MRVSNCQNLNHRRSDATVRFCPSCGAVVSEGVAIQRCTEEVHAKERMDHSRFCVHCGKQLIQTQGR